MQIVSWLLAIFLGVVITILIHQPIQFLLASILGGWVAKDSRNFTGMWKSEYFYEEWENDKRPPNRHIIELRQFGNYVVGKSLIGKESHIFRMRGKVYNGTYLTGVWESTMSGNIHHGAFQGRLNLSGDNMEGKILGTSSQNNIRNGHWKLELISKKIKKDREAILASYQDQYAF